MNAEWHYTKDGASQGPVTAAELKQLATAGKIQRTDLIWKEGMANWVPATSIKGLFPASGPPPAAPRPPPPPASAVSRPPAVVGRYPDAPPPGPGAVVAGPPAAGGSFLAKAKTLWSRWTTPIKVIVVCGAAGMLLMCFMVPVLVVIAAFSGPSVHSFPDLPNKVTPAGNPFPKSGVFGNPPPSDPADDKPARGHKKLTQAELNGMEFNQIEARLGPPDESYEGDVHSNVKLDVWDQGDGEYTVLSYIEAIDGSGQVIIAAKYVDRPRSVVENLITTVKNQ